MKRLVFLDVMGRLVGERLNSAWAQIAGKVNGEVLRALQSVEMKERLAKLGTDPMAMSPAESDAFIAREYHELGKIMRDAGAQPQ